MSKRILIIRLGSLGDIILTSSAIINLKVQFPDSRISLLCKERFRPAAELLNGVDRVVTVADDISARRYIATVLQLDRENFHLVVDLQGNIRSWLARKAIVSEQTVVYPKRRYERMVAVKRKVIPRAWPHTIDLYNEAVLQSDGKAPCRRPVLRIAEDALDDAARQFVAENSEYVVVATGAAHPNKQWPVERFAAVARMLHEREKVAVVWAAAGNNEVSDAPPGIDGKSLLHLVNYPLSGLVKLISSALLTIANDSGIAHASSAVGTPVVALFGPTHPCLGFAPRGMFDRVIEVDEPCRPCSLHGKKPCFRESRYCFDRIGPEQVYDEAVGVLEFRRSVAPAVFVDRDGTIMVEKNFLSDPEAVELESGAVEALRKLKQRGYKIVVISNQSGVARGFFDTSAVERVNGRLMEILAAEGVEVDGMYFCPHHPRGSQPDYAIRCDCRKPAPGMAETAAYQLNLDLRRSYVIGDKMDDINLAAVTGATPVMVTTGYGQSESKKLLSGSFYRKVKVADNILEAAAYICRGGGDD